MSATGMSVGATSGLSAWPGSAGCPGGVWCVSVVWLLAASPLVDALAADAAFEIIPYETPAIDFLDSEIPANWREGMLSGISCPERPAITHVNVVGR